MRRVSPAIAAVVEPVVSGLGYEYVGAEFGQAENGQTLRVYIDTSNVAGILIDDCVAVSEQLSAALDVDDVVTGAYQLEVSSPGVDRPLFSEAHFMAEVGHTIKVKMAVALEGRRNYKGELKDVSEGVATVVVDGVDHHLTISDVEQANLIGELPKKRS